VANGQAAAGVLPALPGFTGLADSTSSRPATPLSARDPSHERGFFGTAPLLSQRSVPPLANTAAADSSDRGPRVLFREGYWGVQPPLKHGFRKPAGLAKPVAFGHSALRGAPLPRSGRGTIATARWVGTEGERLRAEAYKSLGSSAHVAWLVNAGPESMEPLRAGLIAEGLLS